MALTTAPDGAGAGTRHSGFTRTRQDIRAAAAAFGVMRQRLDHLIDGADWYRVAPNLFAAFGNDQARFAAASDARIAFELGRAIEFHEQRRRAGAVSSARKAQASRRNGRKAARQRDRRAGSSPGGPGPSHRPTRGRPNALGSAPGRSSDRR